MNKFMNYVDIEMARDLLERSVLSQVNHPERGYKNVFLHGQPSLGKSAIIKYVADKHGYDVIDLRLAGVDESAVLGLPYVWEGIQYYSTPSWWPSGERPCIILLDELKNARPETLVAAFRLILDREIQNGKKLPDNCVIVAAGNMQTDKTGARELSVTLATRFSLHLVIDPATTNSTFLNYAINKRLNRHIVGYLEWRKQHTYEGSSLEAATAVPRTWERLSENMEMYSPDEYDTPEFRVMVSGTIGTTVAMDFLAYLENAGKLPDWSALRRNDEDYDYSLPEGEPGIHFGVATGLALELIEHYGDVQEDTRRYAAICDMLPTEMRIVFFRTVRRDMVTVARILGDKNFKPIWDKVRERIK